MFVGWFGKLRILEIILMEKPNILIIVIIKKVRNMSFREVVEAENEMDDGYFEIIHNFRKVEKTKRRKLLKLYKLRVAGERKKEILKAS
jgi:hypothetical protein